MLPFAFDVFGIPTSLLGDAKLASKCTGDYLVSVSGIYTPLQA